MKNKKVIIVKKLNGINISVDSKWFINYIIIRFPPMLNDAYFSRMMSCRSLEKVLISINPEPLHLFSGPIGKSSGLLQHPWRPAPGKNLWHFDPFAGSKSIFPFLTISLDVWRMRSQKHNQIHHQKINWHLHPQLPHRLAFRNLLRRHEFLLHGHQGISWFNPRWTKAYLTTMGSSWRNLGKTFMEISRKRITSSLRRNSTTRRDLRWIFQPHMTIWGFMRVSSQWRRKWKKEWISCSISASSSPNSCSTPLRRSSSVAW